MPLTRLVYYSTNKLPAAGNISVHLKQILGSAIKNNRHVGVTGGLVFTRNQFSNSAHTSFARRDRRAPAGCGFGSGLIEGYADLVFFPPDSMAHAADLI